MSLVGFEASEPWKGPILNRSPEEAAGFGSFSFCPPISLTLGRERRDKLKNLISSYIHTHTHSHHPHPTPPHSFSVFISTVASKHPYLISLSPDSDFPGL